MLVSYKPYQLQYPELPEPQERVKKPEEIETVEDLYLTGRFVEQFKRPGMNPDDYYLAGLEKSPNDYRLNLAMGTRRLGETKYQKALNYLQKAADKLKVKYYQPKEGELFYYLGMAQKQLGQAEEAYHNFAQSTRYYAWHSAGYYQLAQMETQAGNYEKALEYIQSAYANNTKDGRITILYSALLRKLDQSDQAQELLDDLLEYATLYFTAYYENGLILNKAS